MFGRIDHVGLAVADLEEAIDLHVNVYGLPLVHRETVA
jgi:methylmalonyl-CoA/ethylmalonyl-CoA epimerase